MKIEITDTGVIVDGTQRDVVLMITSLMVSLQVNNVFSSVEGLTFRDVINTAIDTANGFIEHEKDNTEA